MKWMQLLLIIFLSISCRHGKEFSHDNDSHSGKPPNKILFLNLLFTQDSVTGNVKIDLINYRITEGLLKMDFSGITNPKPDSFNLIFTDENSNIAKSVTFNNPLTEGMEYYKEDGTIGWTDLNLPSKEFSIRMQLPASCSRLYISPNHAEDFKKLAIFEISLLE